MRIKFPLSALTLVAVGVSAALAQPGDGDAKKGEPSAALLSTPSSRLSTATYPPPSTEARRGSFQIECGLSHQRRVDPIVAPGPKGTLSGHLHDFFGNASTDSNSTYASMRAAGTTCSLKADTAGYWQPSLIAPGGSVVRPEQQVVYYRNRPVEYGTTRAFPPNFRMIAGGMGTFPRAYWTCHGDSDTAFKPRRDYIPDCGNRSIKLHVWFPSCWDGARLDSRNHRSHVSYEVRGVCPRSHPVKVPEVNYRVIFPVHDGRGYVLSDGSVLAHADFWNTWKQVELRRLVRECLRAGIAC